MDGLLERREMSKFSSDADEFVWEISMDGGIEEFGSVDEGGWYGRVEFSNKDIAYLLPLGVTASAAIIHENDQGFVDVWYYDDNEKNQWVKDWRAIVND